MLILVPLLLICVLLGMYVLRRGVTLTRDCRWRRERGAEGTLRWRCAVCGAITEGVGRTGEIAPRHCLRGRG